MKRNKNKINYIDPKDILLINKNKYKLIKDIVL